MNDQYDVLIVGAGPAGMEAACALAESGADVLVVDEQPSPGGQIWRAQDRPRAAHVQAALGDAYARGAAVAARFRNAGVTYAPATQLWQIEPGFQAFMTCRSRAFTVAAKSVLLATGAQERPVPIPGWTLPGVMTVGAAQILLKSSGQVPQEPVWVCGSGPLPLLYMTQLLGLGGQIAGYLDTSPPGALRRALPHVGGAMRSLRDITKGLAWLTRLRLARVPVYRNVTEVMALGEDRVSEISFRAAGRDVQRHPASVVLLHEGLVPSVHATMALGCAHDWDEAQGCFVPRLDDAGMSDVEGLYVAGDGAGIAGAEVAVLRGRIAATAIAEGLFPERAPDLRESRLRSLRALDAKMAIRPFLDALYPPPPDHRIADEVTICRCEELTAGTLRAAMRAGAEGPNQLKAFTRCGMGPCQGRQCGYSVTRLLSQESGIRPAEIGFFRIRPPLRPVTLGELASLDAPKEEV